MGILSATVVQVITPERAPEIEKVTPADYDEAIWLRNGDFPAAFYNRALAYADKGEYEHSFADF